MKIELQIQPDNQWDWITGEFARKSPTFEQWSGKDKSRTKIAKIKGRNQLHIKIGALTDLEQQENILNFFKKDSKATYKMTIEKL